MKLIPKISVCDSEFCCEIHVVEHAPPLRTESVLTSVRSMTREELIELLSALGFHQTDILDGISAASGESIDPDSAYGKAICHARSVLANANEPIRENDEASK